MHVHVETVDGEAKFWLEPTTEAAVVHGMDDPTVTRARKLVIEHEEEIRRAWHEHFSG